MNQSGGAVAKLLGLLLVIALAASAALYLYGRHQQPLALGDLTVAATNEGAEPGTIVPDAAGRVRVATIVRNAGRLPVTLEGVAAPDGKPEPLIVTSVGLGDGADPTAAAVFTPIDLDPGSGVGIVVVYEVDPSYPCEQLGRDPSATLPLPALAMRFSSYGVTSTQELVATDAPAVAGLTRAACEAAG